METRLQKLKIAFEKDPAIFCERSEITTTFGSNPDYLKDVFNITKNDLIRLERQSLAFKARYVTKTGEHRSRWLIFKEALNATKV